MPNEINETAPNGIRKLSPSERHTVRLMVFHMNAARASADQMMMGLEVYLQEIAHDKGLETSKWKLAPTLDAFEYKEESKIAVAQPSHVKKVADDAEKVAKLHVVE